MAQADCSSCDSRAEREEIQIDGCCLKNLDDDGLPGRCSGGWAEEKYYYLRRYCDIFTKGMRQKWPNLVYIDLFAGPGRCINRDTGDFLDGSPLIAYRSHFTHYFFSDLSSRCLDALSNRLKPNNEKSVRYYPQDANDAVGPIFEKINTIKPDPLCFAFIDPTAVQIKFETIRRLSTEQRLDLLINFPLGMCIKRALASQLASDGQAFDAYFGSSEWRDHAGNEGDDLLRYYTAQLRGLRYDYIGDFQTIKFRERNLPLYVLLFASKHSLGEAYWQKIKQKEFNGQRRLF